MDYYPTFQFTVHFYKFTVLLTFTVHFLLICPLPTTSHLASRYLTFIPIPIAKFTQASTLKGHFDRLAQVTFIPSFQESSLNFNDP